MQPELKIATSIMKREEELVKEVESLRRANLELTDKIRTQEGQSGIISLNNSCNFDATGILEAPIHQIEIEDIEEITQLEFPILRTYGEEEIKPEVPKGSAYVKARMLIQPFTAREIHLCIDTGANFTICSDTFLVTHFGEQVIKQIKTDKKIPRLRSATGHKLKMLGYVDTSITMGTYQFDFPVLVYQHKENTFLLGSDCFFDRLTYNEGRTISFAEHGHEPVPIEYYRPHDKARIIKALFLAPKSSKAITVQVANPQQLTGHSVMVIPNQQEFEPTVSTIQPDGSGLIWVSNNSERILEVQPDTVVADIHLIAEIQGVVLDNDLIETDKSENQWPFSAMQQLKDNFPATIKLKDNSSSSETGCPNPNSTESMKSD